MANFYLEGHQVTKLLNIYSELLQETSLQKFAQLVISTTLEYTSVEKVALILHHNEKFYLKALGDSEGFEKVIDKAPAVNARTLPLSYLPAAVKASTEFSLTFSEREVQNAKDVYIRDFKPFTISYVPLRFRDKLLGLLYIENQQPRHQISLEEYEFLSQFSAQVAVSLNNILTHNSLQQNISSTLQSLESEKEKVKSYYHNLRLLGDIGKEIASFQQVEQIVAAVYDKVNTLMDASVFDIGVLNEEAQRIDFPGSIEGGKRLPFNSASLSDDRQLAVRCLKNNKELIFNNLHEDVAKAFPDMAKAEAQVGELPESVVYLPLSNRERPIGVITVQSFNKNAYSEQNIDVLRNLGNYVAIALENALLFNQFSSKSTELTKATELNTEIVQRSYQQIKLLAEVGQDITANLGVEELISTVYSNVNTLMDAQIFSIGVHHKKDNELQMPATMRGHEKLPPHTYSLIEPNSLAALCYNQLREVVINNLEKEYNNYLPDQPLPETLAHGDMPRSLIYLPLIGKNEPLGVITVQSYRKDAYTEQEANLLRNLAIYAGIALDNALVYEQMEEKVQQRTSEVVQQKEELEVKQREIVRSFKNLKVLSEIGLKMTGSLSTDNIVELIIQSLTKLVPADTYAIGLANVFKRQIEFVAAITNSQEAEPFVHSYNEKNSLPLLALKDQKEIYINDFDKDWSHYLEEQKHSLEQVNSQSEIWLPLLAKKRVVGVITVQSNQANAFSRYHVSLLRNLGVYAAIALDNAEAYRQIEHQKTQLEHTSEKITSSIKYAKRIQNAVLPNRTHIKRLLEESFVFFKPRDIVSGDFFWFQQRRNKIFVAAVDCTGHGVPGAIMSMIGNDLLNEIIMVVGIESPNEILDAMNAKIKRLLRSGEDDNKDGMDIALAVIDREAGQIEFAGARNPLVVINNNEVEVYRGDKKGIGASEKEEAQGAFTKKVIHVKPGDTYYMFSDGFPDQFGGPNKSKFMMKNFRNLLQKIHSKKMDAQKRALRNTLWEWMENEPNQTDDILVIGFRL